MTLTFITPRERVQRIAAADQAFYANLRPRQNRIPFETAQTVKPAQNTK